MCALTSDATLSVRMRGMQPFLVTQTQMRQSGVLLYLMIYYMIYYLLVPFVTLI